MSWIKELAVIWVYHVAMIDFPEVSLAIKNFLKRHTLASLATLSEDMGKPQVAIVYYDYDGQYSLAFATSIESRKLANIMRREDVALAIGQDNGYESMQIEGTARIVTHDDERIRLISRLYKKISIDESHVIHWPIIKVHSKDLVVVEVKIEWFRYADFGDKAVLIEGTSADLI